MPEITPSDIRNIILLGQSASGKTSVAEAILYSAGVTSRLGKVDEGNSIMDYLEEEIKRKLSISTSLAQFYFKNKKINLIDTPGYVDFIGEPISAIRAADVSLLVVDAVSGIRFTTLKLIKEAEKFELPQIIFINKLDKENANFESALEKLKEIYKKDLTLMTFPYKENGQIKGVISIYEGVIYKNSDNKIERIEIPENLKSEFEKYRTKLIESISEADDKLLEKYLESGTLSEEEIKNGFNKALKDSKIFPVFCGSAFFNIGFLPLLQFFIDSVPSPVERKNIKALNISKNDYEEVKADINSPFKGFIFKTLTEPHVGELNFIRVFSGILRSGDEVYNSTKDVNEKIGQINFHLGKEKKETKEIIAGDIGVLVKLKSTTVSDTLCDPKEKVRFDKIEFPKPLLEIAIVPKSKADEDKLSTSIHKLMDEDPTIKIRVDNELKQTIVSGMGEIQLDIFISNLKNKFNVQVETERPKVAYRETIKKKAKAQGKYKRQTGGRGQYGDCWVELEPLPLNSENDFEFVDKIFGGAIPAKYIPAVEKGIREAMSKGVLANYPVIKVRAILYDGSFHPVDSSDIAFQIAGSLAFKNAASQANPVLLEPIMKLKIYIPEEYMGDVISDLNSKRAKILGMSDHAGLKVIEAYVPEAELYQYINVLKSITQGSGSFEKSFDHYEEVPFELSKRIIEARQKELTDAEKR